MRTAIFRTLRGCAVAGCILLLALTAMPQEFPDELQLTNGATVKGQFITADLNAIIFRTGDGEKTFAKSEVCMIYLNKAAPPSAGNANPTTSTTNNQTTSTSSTPSDQSSVRDVPTDAPEVVDAGVKAIEQALRDRDVDKVVALCFPTERDRFRAIFTKHRNELTEVADLLATRKLVETYGSYAEYQVTSQGDTFPVIFTRYGNVWCLSHL